MSGSVFLNWDKLGLRCTEDGLVSNEANVVQVLERHLPFKNMFWFEKDKKRIVTRDSGGSIRLWNRDDELYLLYRLQRELFFDGLSLDTVSKAVRVYLYKQSINSMRVSEPI